MSATEAFPLLSTVSSRQPPIVRNPLIEKPQRRRSSGLGGEIRAGDTGAPAFATSDLKSLAPSLSKTQNGKKSAKRRKDRSFVDQCKRYAIKNTWFMPLVIMSTFVSLYAIYPSDANPFYHFIFLSYPVPIEPGQQQMYDKGYWDIAFVAFYTVVLSFTREFIMQKLLRPMARNSGLKSRAKQARFMEQSYTAIYFAVLGPIGLYVMKRSPVWYFNTAGMYEAFPHLTLDPYLKFYYLFEAAYWAQQAIVLLLRLEKPRKDFKELVLHHFVSLALIGLSYRFHFTHIGMAVYITHDISDFFLATSKVLNYLDHPLVAPYFVVFAGVWIYLRHYLNIRILWSLFNEFQTVGPFELDWAAGQFKCWISQYITAVLLGSLQCLNLFWLFYIFRIAYRFVFHDELDDDRSDNDDHEYAEEQRLDALAAKEALLNHNPETPAISLNGSQLKSVTGAKALDTDGLKQRKGKN